MADSVGLWSGNQPLILPLASFFPVSAIHMGAILFAMIEGIPNIVRVAGSLLVGLMMARGLSPPPFNASEQFNTQWVMTALYWQAVILVCPLLVISIVVSLSLTSMHIQLYAVAVCCGLTGFMIQSVYNDELWTVAVYDIVVFVGARYRFFTVEGSRQQVYAIPLFVLGILATSTTVPFSTEEVWPLVRVSAGLLGGVLFAGALTPLWNGVQTAWQKRQTLLDESDSAPLIAVIGLGPWVVLFVATILAFVVLFRVLQSLPIWIGLPFLVMFAVTIPPIIMYFGIRRNDGVKPKIYLFAFLFLCILGYAGTRATLPLVVGDITKPILFFGGILGGGLFLSLFTASVGIVWNLWGVLVRVGFLTPVWNGAQTAWQKRQTVLDENDSVPLIAVVGLGPWVVLFVATILAFVVLFRVLRSLPIWIGLPFLVVFAVSIPLIIMSIMSFGIRRNDPLGPVSYLFAFPPLCIVGYAGTRATLALVVGDITEQMLLFGGILGGELFLSLFIASVGIVRNLLRPFEFSNDIRGLM